MSNNIERIENHLTEAGQTLLSTVNLSTQIAEIAEAGHVDVWRARGRKTEAAADFARCRRNTVVGPI